MKATKPFTIAPGPNNPVGNTWIDLGDGFGDGTPEPQNISKTESHGCVRLTNWDAEALGGMVHRGTKVEIHQLIAQAGPRPDAARAPACVALGSSRLRSALISAAPSGRPCSTVPPSGGGLEDDAPQRAR